MQLPESRAGVLIASLSLTSDWTWDEMLTAFRALGGVAENIRLGRGTLGRGLFVENPARPFQLRIPENLLIPVEQIAFVGDRMIIRPTAAVPDPEREFFDKYANAFSWGGGGQLEAEAFVHGLDVLPAEVRAILDTDFGMGLLLKGERETRTQMRFLQSRSFSWKGIHAITPILELANHDTRGIHYETADCPQIEGRSGDEIFVSYGLHDSFSIFHRFGFASREPGAFSLPMGVNIGPIELTIKRSFELVQLRGVWVPQLTDTGTGLTLSCLMLGHPIYPKLSRGSFRALMKPLGLKNPDEEFDRVLHANWTKFLKLLAALEPHTGELIRTLRNMVHYQLEAMTWCVGAREI
jgi:hypothetical protein